MNLTERRMRRITGGDRARITWTRRVANKFGASELFVLSSERPGVEVEDGVTGRERFPTNTCKVRIHVAVEMQESNLGRNERQFCCESWTDLMRPFLMTRMSCDRITSGVAYTEIFIAKITRKFCN